MEYLQDHDWLDEEDWEDTCDDLPEYMLDDEDAEASDQALWDTDILARTESEWNPSEEDDNEAVDTAMDSVL